MRKIKQLITRYKLWRLRRKTMRFAIANLKVFLRTGKAVIDIHDADGVEICGIVANELKFNDVKNAYIHDNVFIDKDSV